MNRLHNLFFVVLLILISRCTPEALTADKLQDYIMDEGNGLTKHEVVNGISVRVTYRPSDLWVHQEVGHLTATPNQQKLDSIYHHYNDQFYFIVSLSQNEKEALHQTNNFNQYSDLLQTLSFRMSEYVTLTTTSLDTIPLGDFILNRTYGIGSATELLFVFNRSKALDQDWIQVNVNEFGLGTGNHRFRFRVKDLLEVPRVRFETE